MKWYVHCKLEIPPVLLLGKPLHWMTMNWKTNLIVQTMRTQLPFPFLEVEIVKRSAVKSNVIEVSKSWDFQGGAMVPAHWHTVEWHKWAAPKAETRLSQLKPSCTGWQDGQTIADSTNIVLHCNVSTNIWEGSTGLVGFLIDQVPKIIWLFRLFKGWLYQLHFTQIQTMC